MTTVLIIGGYGTFGRRLVRLLSDQTGLTILIAGRKLLKAEAVIADLPDAVATLCAQRIDRAQPLAPQLDRQVDIVVDAVGPFHAYGTGRDLVLDFCTATGATYIDLSDNPDFCAHIITRAVDAPITVATGWSTFSAVTGAITHHLRGGPSIAGLIPNPKQPMGRAVIKSVLSYAGQPVGDSYGLTRGRSEIVNPPGTVPMRRLLFSNIATADSVLIHPASTGWVAPQPVWLHRLLIIMARLVKHRLFPPLSILSGIIHKTQSLIRFGEARGGLFVDVKGQRFDLIGDGDAGPDVPVIPAASLICAIHRGEAFATGLLRPGADFPLHRLTPWFDRLGIHYGVRHEDGPLYARILGGAMTQLPEPVQDLHRNGEFTGEAQVTRGRNPLSRVIANLFGLPKAGQHPLHVSITVDDQGRERWSRVYSGREMFSRQKAGTGKREGLIIEQFGPIAVYLALSCDDEILRYHTRGWSIFGLPLPHGLAPGGDIHESVDAQGRFRFHVDMIAPGLGRLVRYEGWLIRSN